MKKFFTKAILTGATAIIVYLMVVNFLLHMFTAGKYGPFFDEFYYYSMSGHLSLGYMDVPPITALLMALSRLLLGDSIPAMHVFPALAGSFTMLFASLTARKMGGGRFSQALTAVAVMLAPVFMTFFDMFTYDAFDQLMSAIVIFLAAKFIMGETQGRTWILLGLAAGIGLMVKITMGFLLVCLIIGILLTRARKYLANKWLLISIGIAALCCVPFIIWQAGNGFPIYQYLLAYKVNRTFDHSALDLFRYVFVVMNPGTILLWLGGLILLFTKRGRIFRPFAWGFIAYFIIAAVLSVKFYALADAMLPLIAFGSVCLEKNYRRVPLPLEESNEPIAESPKKKLKIGWILKVSYLVIVCLLGGLFIPVSIPVLSPKDTANYDKAIGYSKYVVWDNIPSTGVPTYFAGRLGWDELAQAVSKVYNSLPESDKKDCLIYCGLYGGAGAMDYYGKKYGLPPAICAEMGCYYWGYNGFDGKCLIYVDMGSNNIWEVQSDFQDVQSFPGPEGVPYSTLSLIDQSIYVCKDLEIPVDKFWSSMKTST